MRSGFLILTLLIPFHFVFAAGAGAKPPPPNYGTEGPSQQLSPLVWDAAEMLLERIKDGQSVPAYVITQTAFIQISLVEQDGVLRLVVGAPVNSVVLDESKAKNDRSVLLQDIRFSHMIDAVKNAVTQAESRLGERLINPRSLNPANWPDWDLTTSGAHVTVALSLPSGLTTSQLATLITLLQNEAATCRGFLGDYQTR